MVVGAPCADGGEDIPANSLPPPPPDDEMDPVCEWDDLESIGCMSKAGETE